MRIHGNDQCIPGLLQDLLTDPLPLAADDHGHGAHICLSDIPGRLPQRCHRQADSRLTAGIPCFRPGGHGNIPAENGTHTGPDYLMAERVRAALQQSHRHIPSIRRAQDGAHVSGVLDPVQQQHSLFRDKGLLFRQTAQKHRPLGGLHGGNCLHDLFAHPDNPNVLRQLYDVVVTGEGTLDCDAQNGDWWVTPKIKRIAWRPRAVAMVDSENICLHGITVQNSYSWTIHPIFVKHLDLLNFNINNPYNAPNTDGIDPESCEYTRIIGVNIHVGDDCIAMKASKVFLGMKLKKSCEHTVIRNCLLDKGHGGIVIGSEMSGGVKSVVVTQCLMDHTDRGLRVKTRRGRGNTAVIDGLVFRNVEMRGVKAPFVINMFYFCDPDGKSDYVQSHEPLPLDDATPRLGSLTMENITATDAEYAGCWFSGLPEQPVEKVEMNNVSISFAENAGAGHAAMMCGAAECSKLAIWAENVKEIHFHNVKLEGYAGERLNFINVGSFKED